MKNRPSIHTLLSCSAAILLLLVLVSIGRLGSGVPAGADLVNQSADYQMLAVDAGSDDVVLLIDQRNESIMVYHAMQNSLKFLGKRDIKDVFAQARAAAGK